MAGRPSLLANAPAAVPTLPGDRIRICYHGVSGGGVLGDLRARASRELQIVKFVLDDCVVTERGQLVTSWIRVHRREKLS